jgi:hypothetical protein
MVSLSIFVIIMTMSMGAILSVLDTNAKSQTRKVAIDNLNFAIDSMSRTIRFGTVYHCGAGDITVPADCSSGSTTFSLLAPDGNRVTYTQSGSSIVKSTGGGPAIPVTSPEINIQSVSFRVFGSSPYVSDVLNLQPQVIITITGSVGSKIKTQTSFSLQTTVSQRKLDI